MAGDQVDEFCRRWAQALAGGARSLVINLADVTMIDSSGMGALVRCAAALSKLGGRMKLAAANDTVMQALKFTRLEKLFAFCEDEAGALAALAAAAEP